MSLNIVDVIILLVIGLFIVIGWRNGFIKMTVSTVGVIIVFVLSFLFKNPIAEWLTFNLPFFSFFGYFKNITILNVVVYQLIAFIIIYSILMVVYSLVLKLSGLIERVLNFTIILGIPSKLLGAFLGLIEGIFVCSIVLMIITLPIFEIPHLKESKVKDAILSYVPIVSSASKNTNEAIKEIIDLKETYEGNKEEFNLKTLEILLKYKVIDYDYSKRLLETKKLKIKGADKLIEKYKTN